MENLGQNAQFKRNVIMSATMTKIIPTIDGISKQMNIACIYDMGAPVFNFTGDQDTVDAHDGSAQVSSLWSILENKSLGSNEVGTVKKPIHQFYNDKYMTATFLKYATDTITNNWMRQSDQALTANLKRVTKQLVCSAFSCASEFCKILGFSITLCIAS